MVGIAIDVDRVLAVEQTGNVAREPMKLRQLICENIAPITLMQLMERIRLVRTNAEFWVSARYEYIKQHRAIPKVRQSC